jgi:Tfp pilus assembly protein PilF
MNLALPTSWLLIFWLFILTALTAQLAGQVPSGITESTQADFGGRNAVAGSIVLPSGSPPNNRIRIRLSSPGREVSTNSDEAGRFFITGLPNGSYTVEVDGGDEFETQTQSVDVSTPPNTSPQTYTVMIRLRRKQARTTKPSVVNADLAGVPKRAIEFYEKGGAKAASGDPKGAVEQLTKAVAEYPAFFLAHSELGVQYQKLNDLERADHHLQAALKIKPEAYEPLANRGIVLVRLRKYTEAEPVLRSAIKIKDNSPVVYFYLGRSLLGQKRPDDAEPTFKTAFEKGGNDMIEARRALATIYLERGENEKAVVEIEAYLAANPTAYDAKQLQDTVARIKEWLKANAKP